MTGQCIDRDQGVYDSIDLNCGYYDEYPEDCGFFDDDDFTASSLCCACNRSTEQHGNEGKLYLCGIRNIQYIRSRLVNFWNIKHVFLISIMYIPKQQQI